MNRREALRATVSILGGTIVGAQAFLACNLKNESAIGFVEGDLELLSEIAETILPATPDSLGAKAANIGLFVQTMVNDCYSEDEQKTFFAGLNEIKKISKDTFNKVFTTLTESEKLKLLSGVDEQAQQAGDEHYFSMMKQLVVLGYFSSEIGATQALRYEPIPCRYDGCVPYQSGEKAWAG